MLGIFEKNRLTCFDTKSSNMLKNMLYELQTLFFKHQFLSFILDDSYKFNILTFGKSSFGYLKYLWQF